MATHAVPALAMIVHPAGAGGDHDEPADDKTGDEDGAKLDAADALIEALHAKDTKGVVEAFEALCDLHKGAYDDDEDEEDAQ